MNVGSDNLPGPQAAIVMLIMTKISMVVNRLIIPLFILIESIDLRKLILYANTLNAFSIFG